jgi:predicted PurR-regulated permease PerM
LLGLRPGPLSMLGNANAVSLKRPGPDNSPRICSFTWREVRHETCLREIMASREVTPDSDTSPEENDALDAPGRDTPTPVDAGPDTLREERRSLRSASFHWVLVLTCAAGALALVPLWAPMLLASWMAMVVRPLHTRFTQWVKGSGRAAAVVTVLLVVLALLPVVIMSLSLFGATAQLIERVQQSGGPSEALKTLLTSESVLPKGLNPDQFKLDAQQIMDFAKSHGGGALNAAGTIFGAATTAFIGLFVFVYGFYTCLVDASSANRWLLEHSPLERWETLRLSKAYAETGRGLLIGVGLTALFQGGVATLGYVIIGVPQALVLGLVTTFAALIPSFGTGLVWAPLALGLAISGHTGKAIAVVGLGCAISVADNFIRPFLSRFAKLDLQGFVLFVAMLGGITIFGTWGLLLGPLCVRLAVEALRIGRDRRELGGGAARLLGPDGAEPPFARGD